ncbi:uncharacterized protein LOC133517482 [Cydia pomonella]|uniref:uncharacterized protein LOC133517482 n=1 Tax=Cydia pomonella TaxID=82600 RepID=UPI002ADDF352|nr:uncharacterized protein LOC133517482 [Cydia pomonella]
MHGMESLSAPPQGTLTKSESQPDLPSESPSGDDNPKLHMRKRKQPDHDYGIKQEIQNLRKDIMAQLTSSSADLKEEIRSVLSKTQVLINEQAHMKVELTDLKTRVSSVEDKSATLSTLQNDLTAANEKIENLITENNNNKQFSMLNNVEISGIPLQKGENLNSILCSICNLVGYKMLESDVDTIYRVRRFVSDPQNSITSARPPAIIVRFTQRRRKDELLGAVRARRGLTTADISLPGPATAVYIGDHLTPANKLLLKRARQLKVELNYSFVWTRDCKIFMRKTDTSKVIQIRNIHNLENLK